MALSSSWGFTNTTASTASLTPTAVGMNNYAVTVDDPGNCVLKNVTSPIDQVEVLQFQSQDIANVYQKEKNVNPPKVQDGRQITAKIEAKKRVTSSVDDTFIEDLPVSCNITWRFVKSSNITANDLLTILKRVIGAMQDESTDGYIIDLLMMENCNPKNV